MRKLLLILALLLTGLYTSAQSLQEFPFGTDSTFEIMTWNLQGFPKNGQTTVDYVKQIIESLDVDLVAIQELDDLYAFDQMVSGMDGYSAYVAPGANPALGFICKNDKIQVSDVYEIYSENSYWRPFPRAPLVIDLNFMGEQIFVIDNHLKCCGDGILDLGNDDDEENRRYIASYLLKDYIEANLNDKNVIVNGDLNDEITDEPANNVFQTLIDDSDHYRFSDMAIATGPSSGWSYPTWPSHIDHLLITNELFDEAGNPGSSVQSVKAEELIPGGWNAYENNVTDHRPVAMRLQMNFNLGIPGSNTITNAWRNFPNPFSASTTFRFPVSGADLNLEIRNVYGETVFTVELPAGISIYTWNAGDLPPGVYLARFLEGTTCIASRKIVSL